MVNTASELIDYFAGCMNSENPINRRVPFQGIFVRTKLRNQLYLEYQGELLLNGTFWPVESVSQGGGIWKVKITDKLP